MKKSLLLMGLAMALITGAATAADTIPTQPIATGAGTDHVMPKEMPNPPGQFHYSEDLDYTFLGAGMKRMVNQGVPDLDQAYVEGSYFLGHGFSVNGQIAKGTGWDKGAHLSSESATIGLTSALPINATMYLLTTLSHTQQWVDVYFDQPQAAKVYQGKIRNRVTAGEFALHKAFSPKLEGWAGFTYSKGTILTMDPDWNGGEAMRFYDVMLDFARDDDPNVRLGGTYKLTGQWGLTGEATLNKDFQVYSAGVRAAF